MNYALSIDQMETEQLNSEKVITFSFSSIQAIRNIPNKLLAYIILPLFIVFFIPLINYLLWRILKQLTKEYKKLQIEVYNLKYEEAKKLYERFTTHHTNIERVNKTKPQNNNYFFLRGIFNKFLKIESMLGKSKQLVASTLFVQVPKSISEEDKKLLQNLEDFWGDDADEVYAEATHYHLTHGCSNV